MLVFVSCSLLLEKSSDRGPVSFFLRCNTLGNLLMLVRSGAARALGSCTRTVTTGVRVLLESSVARVLLSAAAPAAAEWSCSRDCLATRRENMLYPSCTYLVDLLLVSRSDSSFMGFSYRV